MVVGGAFLPAQQQSLPCWVSFSTRQRSNKDYCTFFLPLPRSSHACLPPLPPLLTENSKKKTFSRDSPSSSLSLLSLSLSLSPQLLLVPLLRRREGGRKKERTRAKKTWGSIDEEGEEGRRPKSFLLLLLFPFLSFHREVCTGGRRSRKEKKNLFPLSLSLFLYFSLSSLEIITRG